MNSNIGKNIKSFREKLGITQFELADYCGISREIISYYETGKREVNLLHLENISEYLNIDMDQFLEDNPAVINPELALTFRANELSASDREQISDFKKIVRYYLKMKNLSKDGIEA
jgi:transcriptional regulator with XRE-family HTH domain